MNIQKLFNFLLRTSIILVAAVTLILGWLYYIDKPYLSYTNLPLPTGDIVGSGKEIPLLVERCSTSDKPEKYSMTINIRNELTKEAYLLPSTDSAILPGCQRANSKLHFVPTEVPPGVYTLWGIATVQGTVRDHKVIWYSEPFEVTKQDTEAS